MHLTISKSDVLQSIGFALTSAKEDWERVKENVGNAIHRTLLEGEAVSAEAQAELSRALTTAKDRVEAIDVLRRMAEFAKDEVHLTETSFKLLEVNLPAR